LRLSDRLIEIVKKSGVQVYFASRNTTKVWNETRMKDEPLRYGGWYWMRSNKSGKVIAVDEDGPFRSESAAIRDAYIKLQLRSVQSYRAQSHQPSLAPQTASRS
jgi:hypothetical protein